MPKQVVITAVNKYGEPMAKKPTKIERMPAKISQPRLWVRGAGAEDIFSLMPAV
jgi:hypothetical protein